MQADINAADQHSIVLAQLTINPSFVGNIGTSATPGGYWRIGSTILTVLPVSTAQVGQPTGSGRIKIDQGSTPCTINIGSSAQLATDAGLEPIRLLGSAIAAINVTAGTVGIATSAPGETATVTAINATGQSVVNAGPGVTWTSATSAVAAGGTANVTLNSGGGTTATTSSGAAMTINGTTAVTTLNVGGTTNWNVRTGGTDATTANILTGGTLSLALAPAQSTITTVNGYAGGQVLTDPAVPNHLIWTTLNRVGSGVLQFQ